MATRKVLKKPRRRILELVKETPDAKTGKSKSAGKESPGSSKKVGASGIAVGKARATPPTSRPPARTRGRLPKEHVELEPLLDADPDPAGADLDPEPPSKARSIGGRPAPSPHEVTESRFTLILAIGAVRLERRRKRDSLPSNLEDE